jgi:hypothetical protein
MKLKISKQGAESVSTYFMPTIMMMANMRVKESEHAQIELLSAKLLRAILEDVDIIFKKKLLTQAKDYKIKMNDACGIVLLKFLLEFPVPENQFWLHNLRQNVTDQLHKQIN